MRYSVDFLVASHIKKRSSCTTKERLDFGNVAAVMCKAGCDALFEQGYIFVDETGVIREGREETASLGVTSLIRKVVRRTCSAWSTASEPYFKSHRNFFLTTQTKTADRTEAPEHLR